MSDVQVPAVNTAVPAPAAPVVAAAQAVAKKPLNAIQLCEQKLIEFVQQRERAIANVHAIDGAIQGAQQLLAILKKEAEKAEAFAKDEAEKAVKAVETAAETVAADVKAEASKVEEKVVSIAEAVKKAL